MYQVMMDKLVKEWVVGLEHIDLKNPNEITNLKFNPIWKDGSTDIYEQPLIWFDRVE